MTGTDTTPRREAAAGDLPEGLTRQRACELLGVSRASAYRDMAGAGAADGADAWSDKDERLAAEIDGIHVESLAFGARKISKML
ncbi:hypothetical protein [Atopobium sp. oral taxon 416]|uniref:hypothetical protein n=1 Tax=Atopobium sp. oral taxon 416 TaxID=712157 RepID=UPI001BA720B0|nr:hypothetical protein [Atopobium sp. oral taxon 416]QUC04087.1 hypothetical protein J4859_03865 [Atopobium sp. oral taxon 416]